MPDVTPVYGWPVPVLTDSPNIPSDVTSLANAIEGTLSGSGTAPIGDSSNSATLSSDVTFTANQNKNILPVTFTLDHPQWVLISAKTLFDNGTAGQTPAVAAYVDVDAVIIAALSSGVHAMGASTVTDGTDRLQITLPTTSVFLAAGSHTIRLRGDRDATAATVSALASSSTSNNTYSPTTLTIIV